jgi:hypothetical protein
MEDGEFAFLPDYRHTYIAASPMKPLLCYNQFTGWLAASYDEAKRMTVGDAQVVVSGGVLAESMGLGKTVEVLACILGHVKPLQEGRPETILLESLSACEPVDCESMTVSTAHSATNSEKITENAKVGFVGDLDEFGDAEDSSDEESPTGSASQPVAVTRCSVSVAVPVTPEKPLEVRHTSREDWVDDDELGSCVCGKIIGFAQCHGHSIVVCSSCQEPMHRECAPYEFSVGSEHHSQFTLRQRFTNKAISCLSCNERFCPSCIAMQSQPIASGATLIITPPSILDQWRHEISRHTLRERNLNVVVYEGVKASQSTRSTPMSVHLLHPPVLAKADIVLMTFDSLMSDLGHSDDNRFITADPVVSALLCDFFLLPLYSSNKISLLCECPQAHLRKRKRYRVVASPLISIKWWRVILDEAQRVESPTANSARMALKLTSCHRWAVTGTPLGRGKLDDLFGLLLFLRLNPFTIKQLFNKCFQQGYGSLQKRIAHLLNNLIWRSTKSFPMVSQQLGLLEQVEKKVVLRFSSIEKHFYNQQLQEALSVVGDLGGAARKGKKYKAAQLAVTDRLYRLRAACCHPQVGSGGISHPKKLRRTSDGASNSVCRRVMTMEQILITFIEEARLKCEEAQRLVVMHRNAVAAISRLKVEAKHRGVEISDSDLQLLSKSRDSYLDALKLVKGNATPSLILGESIASGSIGFCLPFSHVKNGTGNIAWQAMGRIPTEVCATIDFSETTSKKVTQCRLLPLAEIPVAIKSDVSDDFNWHLLYPNECLLQVQIDSVGGEFVDVARFSLPPASRDPTAPEEWTERNGFLTNKSKSWRIVVNQSPSCQQSFGVFVGLGVELYEANVGNDPIQRLHALTNAITSCRCLLGLEEKSVPRCTPEFSHQELASSLQDEATIIEALYLGRARALHGETKKRLRQTTEERIRKENALYACDDTRNEQPLDCWDDCWWRDFLSALHVYGSEQQKQAVLTKLNEELHVYIEGNSQTLDNRSVNDVD